MGADSEMSNKLKEVILELDKAKNLIRNQQKEIDKLKNVMVDNIIKADYIAQLEKGLESSIALNKAQAERQVKELTDKEIYEVWKQVTKLMYRGIHEEFARAILIKAQEK